MKQFVDYGTATEEMMELLSQCYSHGVSMCITGQRHQERQHL
ncbi:MAG: hypothetical protein ACLTQG_30595 [Hungatella sp.]